MIWVIIPAFNEERALPRTLKALFSQPGNFRVIVVDGKSTDQTRNLLRQESKVTMLSTSKGRALQMNAGADYARKYCTSSADWLLFLHADTMLPEGALQHLNHLEKDSTCRAGGFMHQFSGHDWRLRLISWLDNFRCVRSRIIYGDQALFVRQGLFEAVGGFPSQPILEDVAFCEKLLAHTTPQLLPSSVVTDSRKFVQMGIWRSLARVVLIILHVEYGLPTLTPTFFQEIR
ncbi:MAG: TIGR04283 family arsenosugar biosynthesis glycosyltransferase [Nitrospirota bacterium]|nr:MAG: TIGR04283 family arsenosugar biosynthesis glycosyltransferase [Nitrospirota bacterium]